MSVIAEPPKSQQAQQVVQAADRILGGNPVIAGHSVEFIDAVRRLTRLLSLNPAVVLKQQLVMAAEFVRIGLGLSTIEPTSEDRRFLQPVWYENAYYRRWMQGYLLFCRGLNAMLDAVNAEPADRERARFALNQITAALAPTNHPLGNPGFLKQLGQTKGKSLLTGTSNWFDDLLHNNGLPSQVDERPFKVGRNLAATPGKVVWRSQYCEVIQYGATTDEVMERPILIIPPQINKYYVADLSPENSLVRWAVSQQAQVFVLSWRNPTGRQRDWGLETYVHSAGDAINVVRDVARSEAVNVMGLGLGGITASVLLGYLSAIGEGSKINSLSLVVSALDTDDGALLGVFSDQQAVKQAIAESKQTGVLDGASMARAFSWQQPADLIWSFVANNYLLGNSPPASDVLYWNNDTTRLPAQFHADLLNLFKQNPLPRLGGMRILGEDIDLKKVECPVYVVAGADDQITPWKNCYLNTRLFGGSVRFVLSSESHIPTIVNPPDQAGSYYFTNADITGKADRWLDGALQRPGSWWRDWMAWLRPQSGELWPAPGGYGSARYSPSDAAPGRYIFQR